MKNILRNAEIKAMASVGNVNSTVNQTFGRAKRALANREGQGTLDVAITVLISIVLGALILAGLYLIINGEITERIKEMFNYKGLNDSIKSIGGANGTANAKQIRRIL